MAFALASCITTAQWLVAARGVIGFDPMRLARVAATSALVAAATGAIPLALQLFFDDGSLHDIARVVLGTAGGCACFLLALFGLHHPFAEELRRALGQIRWHRSPA